MGLRAARDRQSLGHPLCPVAKVGAVLDRVAAAGLVRLAMSQRQPNRELAVDQYRR